MRNLLNWNPAKRAWEQLLLRHSAPLKNSGAVLSAQILQSTLGLFGFIFLFRTYEPHDLGSQLFILGVLATFSGPTITALCKVCLNEFFATKQQFLLIRYLAFYLPLFMSSIIFLGLYLLIVPRTIVVRWNQLQLICILAAAQPLQIVWYYLESQNEVKRIAVLRVCAAISCFLTRVGCALTLTHNALLLGALAEQLVGALAYILAARQITRQHAHGNNDHQQTTYTVSLFGTARKAIQLVPTELGNQFAMNVPTLTLGALASAHELTMFAAATRCIDASTALLLGMIVLVRPRLYDSIYRHSQTPLPVSELITITRLLLSLVILVAVSSLLFLYVVFGPTFGHCWGVSVIYSVVPFAVYMGVLTEPWLIAHKLYRESAAKVYLGAFIGVPVGVALYHIGGLDGVAFAAVISVLTGSVFANLLFSNTRAAFRDQIYLITAALGISKLAKVAET